MRKINKRISTEDTATYNNCQSVLCFSTNAVRGIALELNQKVFISKRRRIELHANNKSDINLYSALKMLQKRISSYPESMPYYMHVNNYFHQETVTAEEMLDMFRTIVAFHPLKKIRVMAKRSYRAFPKLSGYKPVNVPQAI